MARLVKLTSAVFGSLLLCFVAGAAGAQSLPDLTAPVNDFAQVIDAATESQLDQRIRALQAASGDAIVVATVDTFQPYGSIEEYAVRLFEKAGVGTKNQDNGALVVLAVTDRRVRIEVGYGLEEFIPDGFAGDTIRQAMLPAFRQGQYGQGLLDGTTRLIQRVADRRGVTLQNMPPPAQERRDRRDRPLGVIGPLVIFFILYLLGSLRRGRRRFRRGGLGGLPIFWPGSTWSGWSSGGRFGGGFGGGGGGFGGFGGFGGGRSGGGGASGGW
jgi:uncharacterized protein